MAPLVRETFQTSREMDFFSEKELVTQTGHGRDEWRSQLKPQHVIGSLLGWVASGLPIIMAGDHERASRFVSRILFLAARRRWRELRCFTEVVTNEHNADAQH